MLVVRRYSVSDRAAWETFVLRVRNRLFLFERDYMDYHSDRFIDHSLCILRDGELFALMPACEKGVGLESHGGLTFGGILYDNRMKTNSMLEVSSAISAYLMEQGIAYLIYKSIPHIYSAIAAQEDEYALFRLGATLEKCEVSSVICQNRKLPFSERRARGIRKSSKQQICFQPSQQYSAFFEIVSTLLQEKFHTQPTHTASEMQMLAGRFPQNIVLWTACASDGNLLAGVLIYLHQQVAHAQYIAANAEGRQCGALDGLFNHLINHVYAHYAYFDFGISTEEAGRQLNTGLITQKEEFGARAIVHKTWRLAVT